MNGRPPGFRKSLLVILLFSLAGAARADYAGQVNWGLQYDSWATVNTVLPFNGSEFMVPFSISYAPDSNWNLYGQTAFVSGGYTDSLTGNTQTLNLSALTATSLSIPIVKGRLALGTWQGIYLWEHRRRGDLRELVLHIGA